MFFSFVIEFILCLFHGKFLVQNSKSVKIVLLLLKYYRNGLKSTFFKHDKIISKQKNYRRHLIRQLKLTPSPRGEGFFRAVVFDIDACPYCEAGKLTAKVTAVLSAKKSPCGAFIPDAQQIM
mgnify:CR=1 FL=1